MRATHRLKSAWRLCAAERCIDVYASLGRHRGSHSRANLQVVMAKEEGGRKGGGTTGGVLNEGQRRFLPHSLLPFQIHVHVHHRPSAPLIWVFGIDFILGGDESEGQRKDAGLSWRPSLHPHDDQHMMRQDQASISYKMGRRSRGDLPALLWDDCTV